MLKSNFFFNLFAPRKNKLFPPNFPVIKFFRKRTSPENLWKLSIYGKFPYQKISPEDGVVWLCHWLVNWCVCLTMSSCYGSILLTLGLIGRDGGLSFLCHSCRFACQQRVLKTFPGPGYLHSDDGAVWLCHVLVNLYIYINTKIISQNQDVLEKIWNKLI